MTKKAKWRTVAVLGVAMAAALAWSWHERSRTTVTHLVGRPVLSSKLDEAPAEVREFLGRALERFPDAGKGVSGYRFDHWEWREQPTHEAVGLKGIPGLDPEKFLAAVMNVDGYVGNIDHVEECRSIADPAFEAPEKVRFYQRIHVPRLARLQQELVLVDVGTIKGYRVAYWYLLKEKTDALDPKSASRSDHNLGAWVAAPGVAGYALSSWPRRGDVNAFQWFSMTSGSNALAGTIIESNIDGMARWAGRTREMAAKSP